MRLKQSAVREGSTQEPPQSLLRTCAHECSPQFVPPVIPQLQCAHLLPQSPNITSSLLPLQPDRGPTAPPPRSCTHPSRPMRPALRPKSLKGPHLGTLYGCSSGSSPIDPPGRPHCPPPLAASSLPRVPWSPSAGSAADDKFKTIHEPLLLRVYWGLADNFPKARAPANTSYRPLKRFRPGADPAPRALSSCSFLQLAPPCGFCPGRFSAGDAPPARFICARCLYPLNHPGVSTSVYFSCSQVL